MTSRSILTAVGVASLVYAGMGSLCARAQEKPFYLHDGDTVVFYGDSITEQMFYTQSVEDYVFTRYPHLDVTFFPEGNGGDRVTGGSAGPIDVRLARDVFPHKPTVITVMLGMNDGNYRPLTPEIESTYTKGYEHILDAIEKTLPGCRVTLLGASPFDDVTRPELFPGGYNKTLVHFAALNEAMAQAHHQTFIDLNAPFVSALKRGNAEFPMATQLLMPDRVHPEPTAHWFMAAAIVEGWNGTSLVSSVHLTAGTSPAVASVTHARVTELAGSEDSLSWTSLEDALPLPLNGQAANVEEIKRMSDVIDRLDQEPLVISGLKPGRYALTIDNDEVGQYSAEQLAAGINLALENTPMHGQAYRVSWLLRDREDAEFIALRMKVNQMNSGVDRSAGVAALADFEQSEEKLARTEAQPKTHRFQVKLVQ